MNEQLLIEIYSNGAVAVKEGVEYSPFAVYVTLQALLNDMATVLSQFTLEAEMAKAEVEEVAETADGE